MCAGQPLRRDADGVVAPLVAAMTLLVCPDQPRIAEVVNMVAT